MAEEHRSQLAEEQKSQLAEEQKSQPADQDRSQLAEELAEERESELAEEQGSQLAEERKSQLAGKQKSTVAEESKGQRGEEQKSQLAEEPKGQLAGEQKSQLAEESTGQVAEEQKSQLAEEPKSQLASVAVLGDVMLGRLVDQIMHTHCVALEMTENMLAQNIVARDPASWRRILAVGPNRYVWGDVLPLLHAADLRMANLETAVTANGAKWAGKAFNFRMHPQNVRTLREARINFCSLANNHILDFGIQGMRDTVRALDAAGIRHSGCGENLEEAQRPAFVQLGDTKVAILSASDHPRYWAAGAGQPGLHFIDPDGYTPEDLEAIKSSADRAREVEGASLVFFSVHWGPNYSWKPSPGIQRLAHDLIDVCGIDLIHGTSAHHVQGVEVYKRNPILYSCGDFVDDYAVDKVFRNDLSCIFKLYYDAANRQWSHLDLLPTKITNLSVTRTLTSKDHVWIRLKMRRLCEGFGTEVKDHDWHMRVDIRGQQSETHAT